MEENQTNSPQSKPNLIFLPIILLVGLLSGLSVYFWQQSSISDIRQELADLKQQINQPQTQTPSTAPVVTKPTPNTDSRILLTPENTLELSRNQAEKCNPNFNTDKPTTSATYNNQEYGLSVEIPYNPAWGNQQYKINPYDLHIYPSEKGLNFGPLVAGEACSWVRTTHIRFLPTRTLSQIKTEVTTDITHNSIQEVSLENGLPALLYANGGLCNHPFIEVIGQKYNYQIGGACFGTFTNEIEEEYRFLTSIAESIKLIN